MTPYVNVNEYSSYKKKRERNASVCDSPSSGSSGVGTKTIKPPRFGGRRGGGGQTELAGSPGAVWYNPPGSNNPSSDDHSQGQALERRVCVWKVGDFAGLSR